MAALAAAASVAGSHVSPQVRSNPKATVECPLSLQHAVGRSVAPKGVTRWFALSGRDMLRAPRIVSRGLAPFAGKGRASARAATGDGFRLRSNVPSRSVQVSRYWLAISERRGRKLPNAPVSAPPGKGCHWPAECVTVWFVHAFLIVKTDSRGATLNSKALRRASFGNEERARWPVGVARRRQVLCRR